MPFRRVKRRTVKRRAVRKNVRKTRGAIGTRSRYNNSGLSKHWKVHHKKGFRVPGRRPPRADFTGARILAAQATDPVALSMYRNIGRAGSAGLSKVKVRARSAVADVYSCKMKAILTQVAVVPGTPHSYYGNSVIDCFRTFDNSDCAYVPELGALYLYYRVTSSRLNLHMRQINNQDALTVVMFCTLVPPASWSVALPTTLEGWVTSSIPHKTHALLPNSGCDRQIGTMSMWCSTSAIFNSSGDVEDFSGLMPNATVGQTGAPPAAAFQWYWGVTYFNYDGSTPSPGQLTLNSQIDYWVQLDGPVTSSEYTPGPDESVPDAEPPKPIRKKSIAPLDSDDDFIPVKKQRFAK